MSIRSAFRARVLAITLLASFWASAPGNAADPFYERLLRDGIQAYGAGRHAGAAKSLQLACFGLLDEPLVLARGLTYLALAQAESGDEPAFADTFARILEIELRYQAFSTLELDNNLRRSLDGHLYRWIALDQLNRVPAFHRVARRKQESKILELAPAERRPELERLVAAEPDNPTWTLLLAEQQLDGGELEAVLAATERVLARDPRLERALCLRGRAGMAAGNCERALSDLDTCPETVDPTALSEARLRCLIRLGDWRKASMVLAEVPPDLQKRAPFRQLARDIRKGRKAAPAIPATSPTAPGRDETSPSPVAKMPAVPSDTTTAEPTAMPTASANIPAASAEAPESRGTPGAPAAEPGRDEISPSLSPELKAELERTRQLLPTGSRAELDDALASTQGLANQYRQNADLQHLTAEIAYRLSQWQEAVVFFRRGGDPEPSQPDRLFYFAVALYETGDRAEARRMLEQCLPSLETTAFVRSYAGKILGEEVADGQDNETPEGTR